MADYTEKVQKWKGPELVPGEALELACKVMKKGSLAKMATGAALGGVVGVLVADKMVSKGASDEWNGQVGFTPVAQMVLGLTTNHLVFWKMNQLTSRPGDLLGGIPRSAIVEARMAPSGLNRDLTLVLSNDAPVELQVPKVHHAYGERLVAALGGAPATG